MRRMLGSEQPPQLVERCTQPLPLRVSWTLLLPLLLLCGAPLHLAAQGRPQGERPQGERPQGEQPDFSFEERSSIGFLLAQQPKLRFTPEQIVALEVFAADLAELNRPLLEKVRELRPTERPAGRGTGPGGGGREAMRQRMEQRRSLLEQMRKNDEQALELALGVLNPEQKKVADDLLKERRKAMEERRGGRRGGRPPSRP